MNKTKKLLEAIILGASEKKAEKLISLDFSETNNSVCNYFVICDAQSGRQVTAIADSVQEFAFKEADEKVIKTHGYENAQWIIIDFGDVLVHVFQTEYRQKYKLEALWADAKTTNYQLPINNLQK